jgi:hypothetical protein
LATLSLVNVFAAIGLTILYLSSDQQPVLVLILASGLALQGLFTAAVLGRSFGSFQRDAERLALIGSGLALIIGVSAFVYGLLNNVGALDPEYGPMTVALLIAAHAAATLAHIVPTRGLREAANEGGLEPIG